MGTSLLAMPWSIERAGLVMGLILMCLITALCLYTSNRILKVQVLHGKYFYLSIITQINVSNKP